VVGVRIHRYVAFVAPRQGRADDARLRAQADVLRRWWTTPQAHDATPGLHDLTPAWDQAGATTRQALSSLADRVADVPAGAAVAVHLTG